MRVRGSISALVAARGRSSAAAARIASTEATIEVVAAQNAGMSLQRVPVQVRLGQREPPQGVEPSAMEAGVRRGTAREEIGQERQEADGHQDHADGDGDHGLAGWRRAAAGRLVSVSRNAMIRAMSPGPASRPSWRCIMIVTASASVAARPSSR